MLFQKNSFKVKTMADYQDENKGEGRTTRLDIAKYLAELSKELDRDEALVREVELGGVKNQQDSKDEINEYSSLAKAGDWQKLLELTEGAYSDGSLKTKIWWVASQYHLELMPVGLLAAPLEAASSKIDDDTYEDELDDETLKVTEDLLVGIGKKLFEENELELGDALYQRAIKLNPSHFDEYTSDLKALKAREEKAPATLDSMKRLSFLEEKLGDVSTLGHLEVDIDSVSQSTPLEHAKKGSSIYGFLCLTIIFALASYGTYKVAPLIEKSFSEFGSASSKVPYEVLNEQSGEVFQLKNPELKPQLVPDSGSLDGILRSLKEPSHTGDEGTNDIDQKAQDKVLSTALNTTSSTQTMKTLTGEVVDTTGPEEPEIVRQILNNDTTLGTDPGIIHENGIDRINKPIIGTNDKTNPIVPAYVIPPKTAEDSAKMYEIKEYTEIRGEPNMAAPVLEKLITGDRVRVAETFGRWARIVSKGGRDGYIKKSALGREI